MSKCARNIFIRAYSEVRAHAMGIINVKMWAVEIIYSTMKSLIRTRPQRAHWKRSGFERMYERLRKTKPTRKNCCSFFVPNRPFPGLP